jgi:hypothetical protein
VFPFDAGLGDPHEAKDGWLSFCYSCWTAINSSLSPREADLSADVSINSQAISCDANGKSLVLKRASELCS